MKKMLKFLAAFAMLSSVSSASLAAMLEVQAEEKTTTAAESSESEEEAASEAESESGEEKESEVESKDEEKEKEKEASEIDWAPVIDQVKTYIEAESVEELFVNNDVHTFEGEEVAVVLNGYAYYSVTNFDKDFKIPFDDQNEKGGIILLNVTVKNDSKKPVFASAVFDVKVPGAESFIMTGNQYIDDETSIIDNLIDKAGIAAGEEVSGFVALSVPPSVQEVIEADGKVTFELPMVYDGADYSDANVLLRDAKKILPLTEAAVATVEASGDFYPDKLTVENMGVKTLLVEELELSQAIEAEDVNIIVDGYQITSFEPNVEEAPSFESLKGGPVIYTFSITVENNGEVPVDLVSMGGSLVLGGMVKAMNEGMLEVGEYGAVAEPGGTGTYYMVFLLEKEMYDKFEGVDLTLELHPKTADEFDDVADYDTFTYEIPGK